MGVNHCRYQLRLSPRNKNNTNRTNQINRVMGTYKVKKIGKEFTEEQLANLYFEHHPDAETVLTTELERWAKSFFESDLIKVYEVELVY